jgi:hypothetical protein
MLIPAALALTALLVPGAEAQLVPEVQLGARGVISLNLQDEKDQTSSAVSDFSDSGILLGFRQKLYNRYRARFVVGFQFPDADSDLGQVFFHQVHMEIRSRTGGLRMGRTRVVSSLLEFPTLRDDDALLFTDALNPFSRGENTEETQFGNVLEVSKIFAQRFSLTVHGEHYTESPEEAGTPETDFSLNAVGASFVYQVPETQRWTQPRLQQAGFGVNNFLTDGKDVSVLMGSLALNLHPDPVHFVDVRVQVQRNLGHADTTELVDFRDLARAPSVAGFLTLRYLYRRMERPSLQLAAGLGWRRYTDTEEPAKSVQVVLNAFRRLGDNFDLAVQFLHTRYEGDLERLFGQDETRFQVGFVYSLDLSWNRQFDDRNSLLNLEHGYIP